MENKDIINSLNERTKQILDDMFSFIDFLNNNEVMVKVKENGEEYSYLPIRGEKISKEIITYSFLLSSLKNDRIIQKFFNPENIDYYRLLSNFTLDDKPLTDYVVKPDFFKSATQTEFYNNVDLNSTFKKITLKLKYTTFLENEDIPVERIEPYQIFDYILDKDEESVRELLNTHMIFNKEAMDNLYIYLFGHYVEFAFSFNVDMKQKEEDEKNNITRYIFENCDVYNKENVYYITFKQPIDFETVVRRASSELDDVFDYLSNLKYPATFQILTVDGKRVTEDLLEKLSTVTKIDTYSFELKNMSDSNVITLELNKYKLFKTLENSKSFDMHNTFIDDLRSINAQFDESSRLYTPVLNKYGSNLVEEFYVKDPSIGREAEIRRLEQILSYPEKDKSIIITGIAGCGKTALVEGLAYRIQNGDVPKHLRDLIIIKIDVATLVAGTKYVGTLEEKMEAILKEASSSKNIVLFIDEIHQALGAGASEKDNTSVAEILKPYLDRGKVRVIGATTTDEYIEHLETDQAFKTRFKRLILKEPDEATIYQILDNLIESYNHLSEKTDYYCPKLELEPSEREQVIKWLISVTGSSHRKHDDSSSNPRLVLDVIKEAYAVAAMRDSDTVSLEDIAEALNAEERLNPDYKKRAIPELLAIKPIEKKDNIILFTLAKK